MTIIDVHLYPDSSEPAVCHDDDPVLLDEVDKLFQLVQPRLYLLATDLLRQRVRQQRQLLVLMVEVGPVGAQALINKVREQM
jgi:hypothetical protein